jgi:purine-binding chemotaxis protein CheW
MSTLESPVQADTRAGKYLTFALGREKFAISVLQVREILGLQSITRLPQTPAHVKGVMNLRGKLIPVIDLRLKFGFAGQDPTPRTCIIVVEIEVVHGDGAGCSALTGIVVDEVAEVVTLQAGEIGDAPDFGPGVSTPYILGMANTRGEVRILLNLNRVMSGQEIGGLSGLLE